METNTSNIEHYKVIPEHGNTYGIGPNVDLESNSVKIHQVIQTTMLIIFYFSVVTFIACVSCKVDETITISWSIILIPCTIALVAICFYLIFYIQSQLGYVVASLFCLKVIIVTTLAICLTLQVYLIIFQTEGTINTFYAIIFIPSYVCFAAPIIYFVMIAPLCISCQNPFFYYGTMIIIYCVAGCVSVSYLVRTQDNPDSNISIITVFFPIWISTGIHFLWTLLKIKERAWTAIFLMLANLFLVIEYLDIDGKADIPWWIHTLLFAVSFAIPLFTFKY